LDKDSYMGFMALHTHPIVESLAKIKDIPQKKALELFYCSDFYRLYEREDTKLWHFSNATLTDIVNGEISLGKIEIPVEG